MSDTKENPDRLALRASPKPVKRLNRTALAVGAAVMSLGLLGVTMASLQPPSHRRNSEDPVPVSAKIRPVPKPEGLDQLPKDYSKTTSTVPSLGPPIKELSGPTVENDDRVPISPRSGFDEDGRGDGTNNRMRDAQENAAAAKAQIFFPSNRRQQARIPAEDPSPLGESPFNQALKLLPGALAGNTPNPSVGPDEGSVQNGQRAKRTFVDGENRERQESDIYAKGELQLPRSPYQVMAGTTIPAALVTGINSDLPGQIIATVTENVYDTVTGQYLLVPQGSRLLGQYDSDVSFGQRRVLLVWTRLIRPDGSSITLDRLPGVDAGGNAGLEGGVDYHWSRIFAGAAASTLIGVGSELAAPNRADGQGSVLIAARGSVQDTINEVGQQFTRRNLNVQPTLTIRPGSPVRIIVQRDLVLKPFNEPRAARSATEEYP